MSSYAITGIHRVGIVVAHVDFKPANFAYLFARVVLI